MRRAWIAVIAVAVLALPGAALAHDGDRAESGEENRSKACKALRAQMGHSLFRETFGTRHHRRNAHGKCVSGHRRVFGKVVQQAVADCRAQFQAAKSLSQGGRKFGDDDRNGMRRAFRRCVKEKVRAAIDAAVMACRTERMADVAAFKEKYGRGAHKRHAFFRCVVQTVRASQAAPAVSSAAVSRADFKNAAKFCKALRAEMGAVTFKQTFGTNKRKSNAYGKCVSKHARTMDEVHSEAVKSCRAEREADPTAFAGKYGTGKNKKNAFGKCVSQAQTELKAATADQIENAAKECKAERKADRSAFASKYGTNASKRNAFGKCVSKTVRENQTAGQS